MKKFISIIGIICLAIIVILNVLFIAKLDDSEHINIEFNSVIYIVGLILIGILIYFITHKIDKCLFEENDAVLSNENSDTKSEAVLNNKNSDIKGKTVSDNETKYDSDTRKRKMKKVLFIVALIIYAIFNIVWMIAIRPPVVGDQIHGANLAQTMYRGNVEEFLPNGTYAGIPLSEYIQSYHQQITLAFVYSIFFRIIHFDVIEVLKVLNILANILTVVAIYKIGKQLSKQYKINNVLLLTLILTFFSLPMLNTFIYGDLPSIALCLFSVYFMMKYAENKQVKYIIGASLFMMLAYMLRMNSLIFIIATVIYLILNLFKQKGTIKENAISILLIFIYLVISIIPSNLVENYYLSKYDLDKTKAYPKISYILMAMEEGPRANGWYNEEIGENALKNPEIVKAEYPNKIKERLQYFANNLGYTFNFYTMKIASMWSENTYSAVWNNRVDYVSLDNLNNPLAFYQKVLLIITCLCSIIVLVQNRKNISLDIIFLILIFIGGFLFHILWEAKSRYILPYIVILIPVASIYINKYKRKKSD